MTKHPCHVIHKGELEPKRKNDCQNPANRSFEEQSQEDRLDDVLPKRPYWIHLHSVTMNGFSNFSFGAQGIEKPPQACGDYFRYLSMVFR